MLSTYQVYAHTLLTLEGTLALDGSAPVEPAKTLHTHGSIKNNQTFSHIALNFYPKKSIKPQTVWFESDLRSAVTGKIQ